MQRSMPIGPNASVMPLERAGAAGSGHQFSDADDDHVLACALAAQADLIVSGDAHLLNLKTYHRIPIVSATEALAQLPQAETEG